MTAQPQAERTPSNDVELFTAFDCGVKHGEEAERAAIAAWLRETYEFFWAQQAATAIESGQHISKGE